MSNITQCFSHMVRRSGLCRMIVVMMLVANAALSSATALGPVDGEGLPATDLERIKIGEPAPDFTLEAETGTPIRLSQFRGQKPVVLVFYRGHW